MRICSTFALVVLLALFGPVGAQGLDLGSVNYGTPAQGGTLVGGSITVANPPGFTRVIPVAASSGDVVVRDGIKVRLGSSDVDMVLQRRMPWHQITKSAAAIGRTLPYVGTAIAFIDLMDQIRLRSDGSEWKQDPGVPQVSASVWSGSFGGRPTQSGATLNAAVQAVVNDLNSSNYGDEIVGSPAQTITMTYSALPCPVRVNGGCQFTQTRVGFYPSVPSWGTTTTTSTTFVSLGESTQTQCPASVDALNPANSIPAGQPVGYDGRCRTGRYTDPKSETAAASLAEQFAGKAAAAAAVGSMLGRGVDLAPRTDTPTASGPASVAQPGTTTTSTGPGGTTTGTSSPTTIITYNGPSYTWNDSTVVTTTNGGGTTTTTTTAPPAPQVETCGLPGKPACKIDETGTPSVIPPFSTTPIDATKTTDAAKQDTEIGRVINPGFGWFSVPPMATCAPIAWPGGVQINPCNGIEVVRSIMAYLWALYGAVWSFGVFRRSLPGAA